MTKCLQIEDLNITDFPRTFDFFIFNILFIIPFQMLNMICFKLIWFGADFRGKLINYSVLKLEKLRNCTESELEIEQFIVGGNDIFKLLDSEKRYLSFWMKEKCKDCIPSLFSIFGHFLSSSFLRLLSLVIGGISEVFLLISKCFGVHCQLQLFESKTYICIIILLWFKGGLLLVLFYI